MTVNNIEHIESESRSLLTIGRDKSGGVANELCWKAGMKSRKEL
jgi:hypothetical protein